MWEQRASTGQCRKDDRTGPRGGNPGDAETFATTGRATSGTGFLTPGSVQGETGPQGCCVLILWGAQVWGHVRVSGRLSICLLPGTSDGVGRSVSRSITRCLSDRRPSISPL